MDHNNQLIHLNGGYQKGKQWNSKLYFVHVLKEDSDDILVLQRESLLNSLEDYVNNEGVSLHKEILYGDLRTQIAVVSVNRWSIDLVVMRQYIIEQMQNRMIKGKQLKVRKARK